MQVSLLSRFIVFKYVLACFTQRLLFLLSFYPHPHVFVCCVILDPPSLGSIGKEVAAAAARPRSPDDPAHAPVTAAPFRVSPGSGGAPQASYRVSPAAGAVPQSRQYNTPIGLYGRVMESPAEEEEEDKPDGG